MATVDSLLLKASPWERGVSTRSVGESNKARLRYSTFAQ